MNKKIIIFGIVIALAIAGLVIAQTQQELQEELDGLEQELTAGGYSWLVNYSGDVSTNMRIEVYEINGTEKIAEFTNLTYNEYNKIYLTGLTGPLGWNESENGTYTQDVFDLKVVNLDGLNSSFLEFDHIIDPEIVNNQPGLVALYHLNNDSSVGENQTHVYDFSGEGNNGTVSGNLNLTSDGILGTGAFNFSGASNCIDVGQGNAEKLKINGTEITVSAWYYDGGGIASGYILGKTVGTHVYQMQVSNGGQDLRFWVSNGSETSARFGGAAGDLDAYADTWVHLVGTYDGNLASENIKVYVNGALGGTNNKTGNIANGGASDQFGIGARGSNCNNEFNDLIDEVAIWNRSLSADEIYSLYLAGNFSTAPNITFQGDTPANASSQGSDSIVVNISSAASQGIDHYTFVDFDDSVVLWMRMDELNESNDPTDISKQSNNGSKAGDATFTLAGKFGSGFEFDGDGDEIDLGDPGIDEGLNDFTVCTWVKHNEANAGAVGIMNQFNNPNRVFSLIRKSSEAFGFQVYNDSQDTDEAVSSAYADTNWHHVCGWYNGSLVDIYIDGSDDDASDDTAITGITETTGSGSIDIGGTGAGIAEWNGTIDEVLIFNRSLSAGEISALYNASANQYINNFTGLADGTHKFTGYAVDIGGNKNDTGERTVTIDSIAPTITIAVPTNNSRFNTNVSLALNYSVVETNQGACWWTTDSGVNNNSIASCANTTINVSQGESTLILYVNDTAGTEASDSIILTADSIFPTISFQGDTPANASSQGSDSIIVNLSTNDSNDHYAFSDFDSSLVGWWRMDDRNSSGDPTDISGQCYDDETEILTLREVSCGEVNCEDKGVVCEWETTPNSNSNSEIIEEDSGVEVFANPQDNTEGVINDNWGYNNGRSIGIDSNYKELGVDDSEIINDCDESMYLEILNDLDDGLVGVIVVTESEKSDNSFIEVDFENKYETLENMGSSFSSEVMPERFIVLRVRENLSDFSFNNFSQQGILSASFIDFSQTRGFDFFNKSHFYSSNISEIELSLIDFSFLASLISLTNDSFNGSSSTGCQSIFSQNSQSSSVTSPVCLNLSDISRFINLTTDSANNVNSIFVCSFGKSINSDIVNGIKTNYKNLSVDGEEEIGEKCYVEEWKLFAELEGDEKVRTLNQETGEGEWELPMAYQIYDFDNKMYKIETIDSEGKIDELVVSPKHKVYVSDLDEKGETSELSSDNLNKLPSKSSGFVSLSSLENALNKDSGLSCGILNQMTENISPLENSKKSSSLVTNILSSDLENLASLLFESPFGFEMASYPSEFKNFNNSFFTFSSNRNLIVCWDDDIISSFCDTGSELQSRFDVLLCEGGYKTSDNFFSRNSFFEHLQDLPDHDSGAFESWLSMTNLTVRDNVFVDIYSHKIEDEGEVFKDFDLRLITDVYSDYLNGEELYFLDADNKPVEVKSIEKVPYSGKIYDVDVGNDIVLVRRGDEKYNVKTEKRDLAFGEGEKIYVGTEENVLSESLFVNPVMMVKVFENDSVVFYLKDENKVVNLNSFEVTDVVPEIFEMLNADNIGINNLTNLIVHGDGESFVLSCKFVKNSSQFIGNLKGQTHFNPINSSNSSNVILECGSPSIFFNFSMYSSLTSSSSTGYQSILSQNSWSSPESVPVFVNLSNISRFINLITAEAINLESNFASDDLDNSTIGSKTGIRYINFSLMPVEKVYEVLNEDNELWLLDEDNELVRIDSIEKEDATAFWSGNSNNGTAVGDAAFTTAGKFGGGFEFDGAGDYVDMGDITETEGISGLTVSAWVKSDIQAFTRRRILSQESVVLLSVDSSGADFEFAVYNDSGTIAYADSETIAAADVWNHVVGVYNGTNVLIYINSVLDNSQPALTGPTAANANEMVIGAFSNAGSQSWNGTIDEVIIFNRSLSADEVLSLYNASANQYFNNFTGLADGSHTFTGYAVDIGGNKNDTGERTVTIDSIAPTITIAVPTNNSRFNTNVSLALNYSVVETNQGACWWTTDSGVNNNSIASCANTTINVSQGESTLILYVNDTAGTEASDSIILTADSIFPTISFQGDTPANASSQSSDSIIVNLSTTDSNDIYAFTDFDSSLVGWWRMDDRNSSGDPTDISGECYDDKTEILTENGWKLFEDLERDERVMTLNQATGESELQLPTAWQEFDNSKLTGEMYGIKLGEGDSVINEEQVYSESMNSLSSRVLNISTFDCFLNNGSLDQIGQFSFNANANIGMSLSCISRLASDSNSLNESFGFVLTNVSSVSNMNSIFSEGSFVYFDKSEILFFNSSIEYSGVNNSIPKRSELMMIDLTGFSLKNENRTLVSATNLIYQPSVLYLFQTRSFASFPSLMQSSSVSSECSNILSSLLSNSALLTFLDRNLRMDSDKFSSGNLSICSFNSLGMDSVMLGILVSPELLNSVYSVEDVGTYKVLGSGKSDIFEEEGNDLLVSPKHKVYAKIGDGEFGLIRITEIYSTVNSGEDVYFLDKDNKEVRVKSIEKVGYGRKIYDVDVGNDIVLVRRNGGIPVWSGNSNNGTAVGDAAFTTAGRFGEGFSFDGDGDYVSIPDSSAFTLNSGYTLSAWIYVKKMPSSGQSYPIISQWGAGGAGNAAWRLILNTDTGIRLENHDGSSTDTIQGNIALSTNTWYHVVGTWNGSTSGDNSFVYVDAVSGSVDNVMGIATQNSNYNPRIGFEAVDGGSNEYFNGTIDEVIIFNRSLSAGEISALYNASANQYFNNFTSLADGSHTFTGYAVDIGGNKNDTGERTVTVDTAFPTISFQGDTPANASSQSSTSIVVNLSTSDSNDHYAFTDFDSSLVGWWRMDDRNSSGDPTDISGECYDDETRVMTADGWKYFKDVSYDDEILTLNGSSGERVYSKPFAIQDFDSPEFMYRIETENGDLVVSPKHKIYYTFEEEIDLSKSSVENILTFDCNLNAFSSDQIGSFNDNAKAKYEASFLCGDNFSASDKNSLYASSEINSISSSIVESVSSNSPAEILENSVILSLLDLNSSRIKCGDRNSHPRSSNAFAKCLLVELFLKNENGIFASTTISSGTIFVDYLPNISLICSSVNSDLDIISSSMENLTSLTNCLITLANANFSLGSNSAGTSSLITISSMKEETGEEYINVSDYKLGQISDVYSKYLNGREIYFLDEKGKEIRVLGIEKEDYSGRIYDVDVPTDIILVERNGLVVWSGNSNNGTAVGDAVFTTAGKFGGGFEFDGDGDYVDIPDIVEGLSEITVSAWARSDIAAAAETNYVVVQVGAGDDPIDLHRNSAERYAFAVDNVSDTVTASGSTVFADTNWHHVVGTYNGSEVQIYVDGSAEDATPPALTGTIATSAVNLVISSVDTTAWNGTIDDVLIFNRSLSADEVLSLYNASANQYINNFTSLADGSHTFTGYVVDIGGNKNDTGERTVTVDTVTPLISYGTGTENDGTNFSRSNVYVNVSVTEGNEDNITFVLHNSTAQVNSSLYADSTREINWTSLSDETYTYNVTVNDSAGNSNNTATRTINLDTTGPAITVLYPDNAVTHNSPTIDINASVIDIGNGAIGAVSSCVYSLDQAANVSMYAFNATFYNVSGVSITHGYHNVTVSCNDTLNNYNSATELDWEVNLVDLSVPNIILPNPVHPNSTLIVVNVSNSGPSSSNVNLTCSMGGGIFESKIITSIGADTSILSNCTYTFYSGNFSFNASIDYPNSITESVETNNENITGINAIIQLRNETSIGADSGLSTLNDDENVYLNITIPQGTINTTREGYNLTEVWVQISRPDGADVNLSLSSYDNDNDGGVWNATYTNAGVLGNYSLTYYANLTNSFAFVESSSGEFVIKNTSISINIDSPVNTTNVVPISGLIQLYNGSTLEVLANNVFLVKLNNVTVSSDVYNDTNFTGGAGSDVNISQVVQLNLTNFGSPQHYEDNYSTTKYLTDSSEYDNIGYSTSSGVQRIFELDTMSSAVGNVTYHYTSTTAFRNATAYITTQSSSDGTTGNTSIWYSLDNSTWTSLNSSTSKGVTLVGTVPVDGLTDFYVRLLSDTDSLGSENPVIFYEINYTHYQYPSYGEFNSSNIYLPNVTYTVLKWNENLSGEGDVILQVRESDDGSTWESWSVNYTNNLDSDITNLSKDYIQWRAFLETTNLNVTPILSSVNISYFNASTNSTGGYSFNITIPTDSLGTQPLEVSVTESIQGITGANSTNIDVWTNTEILRAVVRNYTEANANYSIEVNFSRTDNNTLIFGNIHINISNSTTSLSQNCTSAQCDPSWTVPIDLGYGNYTINITADNESAYYHNASLGFYDFLEERNTTGTIVVINRTITDFQVGEDYSFLWNTSIENTGSASMLEIGVFDSLVARSSGVKSISQFQTCSRTFPATECNVTMNITIDANANIGVANAHFISWRANWTDNDGNIAGGASNGYIQYTQMYVIILGNSTMGINMTSINATIQHGNNQSFFVLVEATGSSAVSTVNISFISETLNTSYVTLVPTLITTINAGQDSTLRINVSMPLQTVPGNYSGIVNVSSANAGEKLLNFTVEVPVNASWVYAPDTNLTYNISFGLDTAGTIGNFTINNTGNVNITFNITYAPGGTTPYTDFGTALFELNLNVSGPIMNPGQVNVSKGDSTNFSVYQKGRGTPLSDVGVSINILNETANPTNRSQSLVFDIDEASPVISNIEFYVDGVLTTVAELNKNVTIKIVATDDIDLNATQAELNVTLPSGTVVNLNATNNTEFYIENSLHIGVNYTANYTPTTAGTFNVTALVFDDGGKATVSDVFNFTANGTATLTLVQNISSITIVDIDSSNQYVFYVNYTVNSTGKVFAYEPNITFVKNETILMGPSNVSFSDLGIGVNISQAFEINVTELTPSGQYNITATLRHRNPDNTVSSSNVVLTVTVSSNKSFAFSPSLLNLTVPSGDSNSSILTINNSGNDDLIDVNLTCSSGTLCGNFTVSFNETMFNITRNNSIGVNVSFTASSGLTAGFYNGTINVSEQNISELFTISATVPQTLSWSVSPLSINSSKAAGSSGDLQVVTISNTGNVDIVFTLDTTNNSISTPNVSSLSAAFGTNTSFLLNYSAPAEDGSFAVTISITNESANPAQINVSVNITSTNLNVTVLSPITSNRLTNVTVNQSIEILANATFEGSVVSDNSTWNITIGGITCSNVNSTYQSGSIFWNISCNAPTLSDGLTYNLTAALTHDQNGDASDTSIRSVDYRDVTPPIFNNITRNNIGISEFINLSANITDNVNVSAVTIRITYPNGTLVNGTMSSASNFYNFTALNLTLAGEYNVNYTVNDTTPNSNSTVDWFEVQDNYDWLSTLYDYDNNALADVNISLSRPYTSTVLASNLSNSNGEFTLNVNKRHYDLSAVLSGDKVIIRNVSFANATLDFSLNLHRIEVDVLNEIVPSHKVFDGLASNSSNLSSEVNVIFNYSGLSYDNVNELEVVKCESWNYANRTCTDSWSVVTSSIDTDAKLVQGNSSGFSSYFLSENKCGNGLCEATYAETTTSCVADCVTAQDGSGSSGGGGGGGGGSSGLKKKDLEKIEELIKSFINIGGVKIETTSIYKELFAGDSTTFRLKLINTLNSDNTVELSAEGGVSQFITFESSKVDLEPNEVRDVLVQVVVPRFTESANYDGDVILSSGEEEGKIPVTIRVLAVEGKLLDVKITPLNSRVEPGEILRLQLDLLNLGKTDLVDVQFDLQLLDAETGELMARVEEAFAVETTFSEIKEFRIPEETPVGKYLIKGVARYASLEDVNQEATSIAAIEVNYPFWKRRYFNIAFWVYLVILASFSAGIGTFYYLRYLESKKKRFKSKVEFNKLAHAGPSAGFIGKVAETDVRAFVDLNKLQMHTLVAGSTGSGKTVAAQGIIEAALLHKKSVVVFDPTAQWTGFLRKGGDKSMLKRYGYFDMKTKEAKAFNGSIKTIRDPYELIDIKKYINLPGEITVFNVSHLSPKEIDIVVASTVEQIFKTEPEESKDLKTLIVYDEVHRLLPKFGGSGQGFVQLERGAREFRKWGIGLILISQVLSDFIGEIKANIGTEIQMGTRYEGDLERVGVKYGDDVLKSVVKEPIGTGMVVNAEYNSGRPFFVAFRPLLHSTKRLSNKELDTYEKYFVDIEDLEYQISQLKKEKVDVLDLELELKLARNKVKEGQFQMSDMYFETLKPKIEEQWKKIGKEPRHLVKEKISKAEVEKGISEAKQERVKYIKKNPEKEVSFGEEISKLKKEVEQKKKEGKSTTALEVKVKDLENKLKPFKGKMNEKDSAGIKEELESLKKELENIK